MSSSSDKDLIQESLLLFRKGMDSLVPLRHFSQHRDEAKIREAVHQEGEKAFTHFTRKLNSSKVAMTRRGDLVKEFCSELDKLTEEYVTMNQVSKEESESFLQERMEVCREEFQSSINAKLLMNPDMDLKSVEDFFESGKPKATDYFEHLWKNGNVNGFEDQKTRLEAKLDGLKKEIMEKQTRILEIKTTAMEITGERDAILEVGIERPLREDSDAIITASNSALAPKETRQDPSLENGIEPEEMNLRIVTVASIQPDAPANNDSEDEIQIIGEVFNAPWKPISGEIEIARNLEIGIKRPHHVDLDVTVNPPTLKRVKQTIPDKNGNSPLLGAILQGQSLECIGKMLDSRADANMMSQDTFGINAAHAVIMSLIFKIRSPTNALAILNLLVANGFHLINEKSRNGLSPLLLAMEYTDLNEEILNWFYNQGANFNAMDGKLGNSVLLNAIAHGRCAQIIRKIIDFGGDPKYVNHRKWNALHASAGFANESALEFFIDTLDVNEGDKDGNSPLHLLFLQEKLEHRYELCLEMLLKKGADFAKKNEKDLIPLVSWMKFGRGNAFPTLIKMKDTLPITHEMASATLTVIVKGIEKMQKLLPPLFPSPPNEFVRFILFMIEDKQAKLLWKGDKGKGTGEMVRMASQNHGQQPQLYTKLTGVSLTIETILACTLTGKNYRGFVELCRLVEGLEGSEGPVKI